MNASTTTWRRIPPAIWLAVATAAVWALQAWPSGANTHRILDQVAALEELESTLDNRVLALRAGLEADYDSLGSARGELHRTLDELEASRRRLDPDDDARLAPVLEAYRLALCRRDELIDDFAPENAILSHSLRFLPRAVDDARVHLTATSGADEEAVEQIVSALFVAVALGDGTQSERSRSLLEDLRQDHHECGDDGCAIAVLTSHVTLALDAQPLVDQLIRRFVTLPSRDLLSEVSDRHLDWQKRTAVRGRIAGVALVLACALLGLHLLRVPVAQRRFALALASANQEIDEQRSRLAEVLRVMTQPVLLLDRSGVVRSANDEAGRWLGISEATKLEGCSVARLLGDPADAAALLSDTLATGAVRERRLGFVTCTGEQRPAVVNTAALATSRRALGDVVLVANDRRSEIAARDAEHRLLASRAETAAAEESSRARSRFLAIMSHELRTPLNGVIGMAELLGYGALDDEQQQQLQVLTHCATELLDLIDAVLEFTASEAEPPALTCVPFDLTSLATDLAGSSRPAAVAKGLRLQLHVAPGIPPQVVGDPARLRQALRLLLDNAVRFTDEGLVALTITCGRELPDAVELRCAVADTGVGIEPADLPRLLQPFTQADESANRRVGGTGLGLARCGQLVRLLGARLEADSTPGEGSCFWFTLRLRLELPVVAPAEDVTERHASSAVADDGATRGDDRAVARLLAGGPPVPRAAPLLLES